MRTSFQFASVCAIGLLSVACDDPNRGPPTRYSYFDAVVEFTAEGQRLKAETTVQCMIPGGRAPGHGPHPKASHSFATKRLPSGAGVMFRIPAIQLCGARFGPPPRLSPNSIPFAYWLDDAVDPTLIEFYVSEAAIGPGQPIEEVHSVHITDHTEVTETSRPYTDSSVEIPWRRHRRAAEEAWIGYLIVYAPKEMWQQYADFAKRLNGQHGFVRLQANEIPEEVRKLIDGGSLFYSFTIPQERDSGDQPSSRYRISLRTRTVLRQPQGRPAPDIKYHVSLKSGWPSGKVVFGPVSRPVRADKLPELTVDGVVLEDPFRGPFLYDARTEVLFRVFWRGI